MTAPSGMYFNINPATGVPVVNYFADLPGSEGNAETGFSGDFQLCVTGVPVNTQPSVIAALITSSPVAIPLPWGTFHWKVAYAALGAPVTATNY